MTSWRHEHIKIRLLTFIFRIMTREEKLEAIYDEMANKEKTIWCKYLVYADDEPEKIIKAVEEWENFSLYFGENDYAFIPTEKDYSRYYSIKEIIWHPVMIGSIFERYSAGKWFINSQFIIELVEKWVGYDKSIDEQSDECIDYVYSLIPSISME